MNCDCRTIGLQVSLIHDRSSTDNRCMQPELKESVLAMRASGVSYAKIAAAYGVAKSTVMSWCNPEYYARKRARDKRSQAERAAAFVARMQQDLASIEIRRMNDINLIGSLIHDHGEGVSFTIARTGPAEITVTVQGGRLYYQRICDALGTLGVTKTEHRVECRGIDVDVILVAAEGIRFVPAVAA